MKPKFIVLRRIKNIITNSLFGHVLTSFVIFTSNPKKKALEAIEINASD